MLVCACVCLCTCVSLVYTEAPFPCVCVCVSPCVSLSLGSSAPKLKSCVAFQRHTVFLSNKFIDPWKLSSLASSVKERLLLSPRCMHWVWLCWCGTLKPPRQVVFRFFHSSPPPFFFQNKWQDAVVFILSFNSCPVSNITLIPFRDPSKQSIYQQGEKQQAHGEVCFSDYWPLIFHNNGLMYWELPMFKTSVYIFIFNSMPMN